MNKYTELATAAEYALAELFEILIKDLYGDDPSHSGPKDEALAYGKAVVDAALAWFDLSNPRRLPRAVVLCRDNHTGDLVAEEAPPQREIDLGTEPPPQ